MTAGKQLDMRCERNSHILPSAFSSCAAWAWTQPNDAGRAALPARVDEVVIQGYRCLTGWTTTHIRLWLNVFTSLLRAERPPLPPEDMVPRGVREGWQAGVPRCLQCVAVAGRSREQRCPGLRTHTGPVARPAWHAVHLPARTGAPGTPTPLAAAGGSSIVCLMTRSAVRSRRTAPLTLPPPPAPAGRLRPPWPVFPRRSCNARRLPLGML